MNKPREQIWSSDDETHTGRCRKPGDKQ